jgi:osmotically-inducible protein OsmY
MRKSDVDLRLAVLRELKWDTRVDHCGLGVAVSAGVVTLTGSVASWATKMAAQEAAHRVVDVLDVTNHIRVEVPGRLAKTDAEIALAVRLILEWNTFIPADRIRCTVSQAWVTLEGDVEFWSHRDDSEAAVRDLVGVHGVINMIEVKPTRVAALDVETTIAAALERHADRQARRIHLRVEDGRVTLSGSVSSWPEKQAVVGAVKRTAGVRAIEDRLRVEPRAA